MKLRVLTAFLVALAATFALAGTASAQDDYDCSDFASQEEAQGFLLPGDPHRLDADSDGIACEELPTAGGATAGDGGVADDTDDQVPVGGVQTGFGGTAEVAGAPWAAVLVGGLILTGLAVPAARLRRA
jgi:hypothetical protein